MIITAVDNFMKITPYKKELLVKRGEIMLALEKEGFKKTDISFIFNLDRTAASRILAYVKAGKSRASASARKS